MRTGQTPTGHGFGSPAAAPSTRRPDTLVGRATARVLAYIALTKPRVIELLLVATIPAMLLADRGAVDIVLILSTLFGGWMGAASANSLNCVVDADIDKVMKRTERRPLARDAVPTRNAFVFGVVLGVASFAWLWWRANLLAGVLVVLTIAFYVLVYTMVLKRRTWQNVIWGGAAGCMPALVGWAAVTGSLSWEPVVLFLVVFFWTPPHTWALAMRYKDDYQAAGVPMLPVIATEEHVTKQILLYTWATVVTTLVLVPAAGLVYAAVALVAGVWFLVMAHQLYRSVRGGGSVKPLRLFLQSNNYLAIVFVGLSIDSVLGLQTVSQLLG
ncbi:heme o synthase [Rhodococcus sp. HNM0569]|uniref:heme o synthase n=1 Tax=Rhodococcus sp. HNM0569 TaxID=2716340 RepID=UPI00146D86C6|nr:protoheme IX farnesyltransferase [Rhodococcus sp. HNM0569]